MVDKDRCALRHGKNGIGLNLRVWRKDALGQAGDNGFWELKFLRRSVISNMRRHELPYASIVCISVREAPFSHTSIGMVMASLG